MTDAGNQQRSANVHLSMQHRARPAPRTWGLALALLVATTALACGESDGASPTSTAGDQASSAESTADTTPPIDEPDGGSTTPGEGGPVDGAPTEDGQVEGEQVEGGSSSSCVSAYTPEALRERSFAFAGTVTEVGSETDPSAPLGEGPIQRATFAVDDWFAGGSGDTIVVWMQRSVAVGDRLLVTGEPRWGGEPLDDAIAWECDFTVEWSDAAGAEWASAFEAG